MGIYGKVKRNPYLLFFMETIYRHDLYRRGLNVVGARGQWLGGRVVRICPSPRSHRAAAGIPDRNPQAFQGEPRASVTVPLIPPPVPGRS